MNKKNRCRIQMFQDPVLFFAEKGINSRTGAVSGSPDTDGGLCRNLDCDRFPVAVDDFIGKWVLHEILLRSHDFHSV